jgi:hypothetical protein
MWHSPSYCTSSGRQREEERGKGEGKKLFYCGLGIPAAVSSQPMAAARNGDPASDGPVVVLEVAADL